MLIHKSGHMHYESSETLVNDCGKNRMRFNNKPLEGSIDHDWNMN